MIIHVERGRSCLLFILYNFKKKYYVVVLFTNIYKIFSEKISPANDGLFVLDGLFVHEGLYVYVQLTYKKAWIL